MFSNNKSNTIAYLNELLAEMTQLVETPYEYKNAQILLSREITRVWEDFQSPPRSQSNIDHHHRREEQQKFTPPPGDFPIPQFQSTPSFDANFVTPVRKGKRNKYSKSYRGQEEEEENLNTSRSFIEGGESQKKMESVNDCHVLQTKIYIPEPPMEKGGKPIKCSYIGRILGPSGMSAKMIERQFDVTLLIRGRGSIRDTRLENELCGRKGFSHLDEPLHVLLIAKNVNRKECEKTLDRAAERVASLMTPVHDELKRDQLLRLSVINGTYVQRANFKTPESSMYSCS
ncbi:unnamed protein product [Caenorhabditis angaria]|uniref:KHDC4/BBP-like KH-domain type I domain-containing protein n=1 Tax=Caenorhabditis angaria TaxID=860376 RepID=A0A9P1IXZ1_9PELO|nr:unnamed protein product [Caenorhabditis angaria]